MIPGKENTTDGERVANPVFLALPIGAASRARLAALCDKLRGEFPGVRWVPPANYHITMRYFGRMDARRLASIAERAAKVAAEAAATGAVLNRVGRFGGKWPRVLWAGAGSIPERLAGLATAMAVAFPKPGPHPFALHATLGRFPARSGREAREGWQRALAMLAADPAAGWGERGPVRCRFGELVLYESVPTQGGVRHEPLERWPLGC
ncbi:RNA 2',3'-cyclic phosphodiesterase [bacterium]|nr:RNA 2',3'-cyclic phosphodiesterase [bacterium]